jgi:sugar phosphate isomerase/epimerase
LWDPGNDIFDPDGENPYPDGYLTIKPYMVHMHLKDARKASDGTTKGTPVGEGQVDYVSHIKELIRSGYDGYVMLETHYRPSHEIGESLLALPKGSAFSHLGYEATEECLMKWEQLLKEAGF